MRFTESARAALTVAVVGSVPLVPGQPTFLIMNNAMGGQINPSDFPQTMQIDYVRVKQI